MKKLLLVLIAIGQSATVFSTTITIDEINNESNASLTIRFPNQKEHKVGKLDTLIEDIKILESESPNIETSPIVFSEQKLRLFDISFIRERKTYSSGRTEVTFKVIQDGKKVLAQKTQGYLYDQDKYTVSITVKPV